MSSYDVNVIRAAGKVAFEAYTEQVGGVTYDGKEIPSWEDLTEEVRKGWIVAAMAVLHNYA